MKQTLEEKPIEKIEEAAQAAAKAETAPPHERRYRRYIFRSGLFVVVVGFVVLSFLVSSSAYFPIDLSLTSDVQRVNYPLFNQLMALVSWPGFAPQSVILTFLIGVMLYVFGLQWEAMVAMGGAFFVEGLNALAKVIIHRPRPAPDLVHVVTILNSYSFPSGHVMFYTAFFGFLWFLAFTMLRNSWLRALLQVFFGALILLVGISRVYLGQHWTSDVVGAYLLGSLALVVTIEFYRWGKGRFFKRQPVAPENTPS